jgi:hypothetical protein
VKFTIEIVRAKAGAVEVLIARRSMRSARKWAKGAAANLMRAWRHRGADGARIVNRAGEEIYRWAEK